MSDFVPISAVKDIFAECPICTEEFDEDSLIPRRLPCCVQSICQPCLETYSRGRQTLKCPLCRHQHHLPRGIKSLPKEPLILKILDHLRIQKGLHLPCIDCPDKNPAIARCDCGVYLCQECINAHKRERVSRDHKVFTFEEMKERPMKSFRRRHLCLDHQQPLQFFCHKCDKVICVSCTVVDHSGHRVTSVEKALGKRAATIESTLSCLGEKEKHLIESVHVLKKKAENIRNERQTATDATTNAFDSLIEELQHRRAIVLSAMEDRFSKELKNVEEDVEKKTTMLSKVKSSTDYTRTMRSKADHVEDLQLVASLTGSLKVIQEEPEVILASTGTDVIVDTHQVEQMMSLSRTVVIIKSTPGESGLQELTQIKHDVGKNTEVKPAPAEPRQTGSLALSMLSTVTVRASVMIYAKHMEKFIPSGSKEGVATVQIMQQRNTFLVVGRKEKNQQTVIHSAILKGQKYKQTSNTFHEWSGAAADINMVCRLPLQKTPESLLKQ